MHDHRFHPSPLRIFAYSCLLIAGCSDVAHRPEAVWMETGVGPRQVVYPRAITYSAELDSFFVVDRMARIQRLDAQGNWIGEWQMPEWRRGKPVGLTVGPDGNVYVADTHYHRVMVYTPEGELVRQWGEFGTGPGQFYLTTDVAFDASGRIFVSEYGDNDRVQVFDGKGNYLYEFGRYGQGDGEFIRPQSLLIAGDLVYISDACNHRIAVFRTDGRFVRNIGQTGSDLGRFRYPHGLDMDAAGNLIVCELGNNRVQKVDRQTGVGLMSWGSGGRRRGELAYPWAIAVDRQGRVVTVDSGNNRLQVFRF